MFDYSAEFQADEVGEDNFTCQLIIILLVIVRR